MNVKKDIQVVIKDAKIHLEVMCVYTCYDGFTRDESGNNCTGKSKIVIYCHLSGKFMTEFT